MSIYAIAKDLSDRFDEAAHPADLLTCAREQLKSLSCSEENLLRYSLSANATIASIALLMLAELSFSRPAAEGGVKREGHLETFILDHINSFENATVKFFALHALDAIVSRSQPLLGRLFVALDDDWSNGYDRLLTEYLREFVMVRIKHGELATFNGALKHASEDRLEDVENLLKHFKCDIAKPLQVELEAHLAQRTNGEFFKSFGRIWDETDTTEIVAYAGLNAAVATIERSLNADKRRSLLVIGDDGVGKTTIIRAAANRLRNDGWVVFEAGGPELISGQCYFGDIEKRVHKLLRAARGRKVLWIVPRFHDLLLVGRHQYSSSGILDMILPAIESGSIAVLGEIASSAYPKLVAQQSRVASIFVNVHVSPTDEATTLDLARQWAGARSCITDELLVEAWHLSIQYLGMRAAPGNLLSLLALTLEHLRPVGCNGSIQLDDLLATLSRVTGLPRSILDDREGLDLALLRDGFARSVMGQDEAIDVLVDRIAMIKAGITDPSRPFGVFLFAGPTGTGKTEVAKVLATTLFGSPDRMIRLDMSELKNSDSMGRLLGDSGDERAPSLVDSIRKQPFSIVLLDEFEKAHPNVWDLFLQLFDDGRLTDRRGVTADFRHAIVIMTTNVGSAIQTFGRTGFTNGSIFHASTVKAALEREFRKELLNRIDRVVIFRPLSRDTMSAILDKELREALGRRGLRNRDWTIDCDESAIEFLLAAGFTPDLGARSLKRAIERYVLTPLAEAIVTRRVRGNERAAIIRCSGEQLTIEFNDRSRVSIAK